MRAQRADDFRVANVDVGMMLGGFGGRRHSVDEGDSFGKSLELVRLHDRVQILTV